MLQAIVPLTLILVMSFGVGMILSTMAVFFRDLEYLWGVALMIIMYASAIFYQVESVAKPSNIWIFRLNPLYALIRNFRSAILYQEWMHIPSLIYAVVFSFGTVIIGTIMFYKQQDKFILNI